MVQNGKLLKKKNTFTDFIDCADYLVGEKSPRRPAVRAGRQRRGLLIGAVVNLRPDCSRARRAGAVRRLITTMLDSSIPLTTSEYDEWGDPNRRILRYMIRSPYDNVVPQAYPNLLVTTGCTTRRCSTGSRPSGWRSCARPDDGNGYCSTQHGGGHGGTSGRLRRFATRPGLRLLHRPRRRGR